MSVRCEDIRELLPEYADRSLHATGAVEAHLATCEACTAELASYRRMVASLSEMRAVDEPVPAGYLERTLALVPGEPHRMPEWREMPERVIAAVRRRPAVASLTGAAIGAAAIGLIAWRRRAMRVPELATQS